MGPSATYESGYFYFAQIISECRESTAGGQHWSYRLLRREGIADHVEFRDHQIVLGRCIASLVIVVVRFLGNGAANGNPVTYVWSKRYVLALKIP
jgi:hypothetical protein